MTPEPSELCDRAGGALGPALPEEPPIEILHAGILTPLGAAGIDIHHRAAGGANDGRERQLNLRLALRNRAVLRLCARKAYGEETSGREDKMAESGTHEDEIPSVSHKAGIRRGAPNAKFQRNPRLEFEDPALW